MSGRPARLLLTLLLAAVIAPVLRAGDPPGLVWVKAKCAVCHGSDGRGNTANGKKLGLSDLRNDRVQSLNDAELAKKIRGGHGRMPDFKRTLTEQQVAALAFFIRSLKKTTP